MKGKLLLILALVLVASTSVANAGEPLVHKVQWQDTLYWIALRYGTTVEAIVEANGIADPSRIYMGQKLVIPTEVAPPALPPSGERESVESYLHVQENVPGPIKMQITFDEPGILFVEPFNEEIELTLLIHPWRWGQYQPCAEIEPSYNYWYPHGTKWVPLPQVKVWLFPGKETRVHIGAYGFGWLAK